MTTVGKKAAGSPADQGTTEASEAEVRARLIEAALRIGNRLVQSAIPHGEGCTWRIMTPDRDTPGSGVPVPKLAPGTLYEGAAGVALFLSELYRHTEEEELAGAALRGLGFALREGRELPTASFGFHTGRVGVAYAAVRAGGALGVDMTAQAEALLRPLIGKEHEDRGLDVINGAAGAIPALLWLSHHLGSDFVVEMARRLGDRLIASAERNPGGWSWRGMPTATQNLCGLSHGAAGMAHALMELYHHTGAGEYLYSAEEALRYERGCFSDHHGNWPDFRHKELGEYLGSDRTEELHELLQAGHRFEPTRSTYVRFWCHGAPGIALSRFRAYRLLGRDQFLVEARRALRTTIESIHSEIANYSLCHGVGGNCEALLLGADVTGDEALRTIAVEAALRGIVRYEEPGIPWPCGTLGGVSDPGLMLGEAGIGLFLLRLAVPRIESVLLVTAEPVVRKVPRVTASEGYRKARASQVNEYFGMTVGLFERLGTVAGDPEPGRSIDDEDQGSYLEATHTRLNALVKAEPSWDRRSLLQDAFRFESERYDLLATAMDATEEYVDRLARRPVEKLDWETARFRMTGRARMVELQYDWEGWERGTPAPETVPGGRTILLLRSGGHVSARDLSPFSATVLQGSGEPASLHEIAAAVTRILLLDELDAPEREKLVRKIREQVEMAYRAGILIEDREAQPWPTGG